MKIETRFDIGQDVWIMDDNRPIKGEIRRMRIDVIEYFSRDPKVEIDYIITAGSASITCKYGIASTIDELKQIVFGDER